MPAETAFNRPARATARAARWRELDAAMRVGTAPSALRALTLALTLALAPSAGLAQRAPPEERFYQVEVLIFAQPAEASVELPPRQPPDEKAEEDEQAATAAADRESDALLAADGPPEEVLPEDDLAEGGLPEDSPPDPETESPMLPDSFGPPRAPAQLEQEAARLERNGYRVLWHQAWIQLPGPPEGVALALLSALGQGPVTPALSGSINLSTRRFLHLGMDLELRSAQGLEAEMSQQRRIRPEELHYFDHPRLGVIAVALPVGRALATEWRLAGPDAGAGVAPEQGPVQPPWRP